MSEGKVLSPAWQHRQLPEWTTEQGPPDHLGSPSSTRPASAELSNFRAGRGWGLAAHCSKRHLVDQADHTAFIFLFLLHTGGDTETHLVQHRGRFG